MSNLGRCSYIFGTCSYNNGLHLLYFDRIWLRLWITTVGGSFRLTAGEMQH